MPPTKNQNIPPTPDDPSLLHNLGRKYILVVSITLTGFVILAGGIFAFFNKELLRSALEPQESFPASNLVPGSEENACYVPAADGKVFYLRDGLVSGADRKSFVDLVKNPSKDCYGKDAEKVYFLDAVLLEADPKTFTVFSFVENPDSSFGVVSYAKDKKHIFVRGTVLSSTDPDTFQNLEGFYAKDKNNVYYYDKIIPDADPNTFTTLSSSYGKDSKRVYYGQVSGFGGYEYSFVRHADPSTFEALKGAFGKDAHNVFALSCFGEGGPSCAAVLDGADPKTFVALNAEYGKDKNHVYYLKFSSPGRIPDADPASFTALSEMVAKDHSHVFIIDQILGGADPNTISVVTSDYIKDGSRVYFWNNAHQKFQVLRDADPATFEKVESSYYKDSKNVYFEGTIVKGADPKTFSVTPGRRFFSGDTVKDSKTIYKDGRIIPMPLGADIASMTSLNNYYFADKHSIYFCDVDCALVDPHPDIETFKTIETYYAKDAHAVYYKMHKMPEADLATFSARQYYGLHKDPPGYYDAKDKNHVYYYGKIVLPNQ